VLAFFGRLPGVVAALQPRANFPSAFSALQKGQCAPKHDASGILTFYMGKNTPERKDFIMGNLVVAVEA
jgi:hypothetical protein